MCSPILTQDSIFMQPPEHKIEIIGSIKRDPSKPELVLVFNSKILLWHCLLGNTLFRIKRSGIIIRMLYLLVRKYFKPGSGKKFERKKVRIGGKVELFSSRTFFLQIFLSSHRSSYATNLADHSF